MSRQVAGRFDGQRDLGLGFAFDINRLAGVPEEVFRQAVKG
jgi:hypothetical protein